MLTLLTDNVLSPVASDAAAPPAPRRRALYLTSQGAPLFAWLHGEPGAAGHGVLICPPLGYEQVHAHRALRHLADALARAGMRVCRLDYHGVGDSPGHDEDPDRVATWQANIRDALTWLERDLGCRRLSVVGLRFGAALAWQVAAEHPLTDLVLWAPVIKGRSYVREMQALAMAGGATEATPDIEAAGFVLTEQTTADITKFDAHALTPRCRRLLIVARDDLSDDRRLVDCVAPSGIDVLQIRQPGYADMMAEPHSTEVPEQAIASIVNWLQPDVGRVCDPSQANGSALGAASDGSQARPPNAPATEACFADRSTGRDVTLRERIVRMGHPDLAGVLTEPDALTDVPLVVLLNAGAAYRVGPNRLYVQLARQLAADGFRCLRLDLGGLGDSDSADVHGENDPYAATVFRDIDVVLRFARNELGARRIVLMGLCSGAYAAFQAAAQFANPALVESVLLNPLTYFWKDGMPLEAPAAKEFAAFHYYTRAALQPAKWWKLLSGQSRIGLLGALKILAGRWRRQPAHDAAAAPATFENDAAIAHPLCDDLPGDLERIRAAGRHLACFFSADDPGHSILMFHARRLAKAMCRAGQMNVFVIEGADHTFSRRGPRRTALRMIVDYLRARYC
jgi:pimeloyl-ACP methyl ester carboxylesterase